MDTETRKIGLVLGSGSARGLAHIGVVRAIRELGLEVEVVAGTSMGALVGAIFCSGGLDTLEQDFRSFNWRSIAALLDPVFPRSGLIDGRKVAEFVLSHIRARSFESLPIPFKAVATDLARGEEVVLASGDLVQAVRASIAVPGVFTPVHANGSLLVDGGLLNPVPVSVARSMGANCVIAVDLNHDLVTSRLAHLHSDGKRRRPPAVMSHILESLKAEQSPALAQLGAWLEREPLPSVFEVLLASIYIMQARITQTSLLQERPEILIQPPLGAIRFMEFDRAEEIIEIGYRCAREKLASLRVV